MSLTVSALSCSRSGRPVLNDLSFELADGEARALRGPNGAGKSTLLRVIAGLIPPAAGRIALDGAPFDADTASEAVAYAGHLDAIKPQLTVAENLDFWAGLFGGEVAAAMAAFDLSAIADRPAHACSAGQKRRLGLARLMLARRRLWLLDEPTVSLDAAATARFCAVVRAHCAAGGMALIATHVELDLATGAPLVLEPLSAGAPSVAADPFLAGNWA
jgi:heme exporter protein A